MERLKEISFANSYKHFSLENSFVELEIHLLGEGADVPDINPIFVHQIFDPYAIHEKNCRIVE